MTGLQAVNNWSLHTQAVQKGTHWWNDSTTRIPEAQIARSRSGGAMNDTPVIHVEDGWTEDDFLDVVDNSDDSTADAIADQGDIAEYSNGNDIGNYTMDDQFKTALGTNLWNNPQKSFAAIAPANVQHIVSLLNNV